MIGVPAGMQPRAAVVYMTVGVLECAGPVRRGAGGCARRSTGRRPRLERLVEEWGPDAPDDSLAKSVARSLDGHDPGDPRRPRPRPRPRAAGRPS